MGIILNHKLKTKQLNRIQFFFSAFVFCLMFNFSATAQEKESTEIHKTKSSATIGGVKYYLHTVEKGQTLFAIAKFYACSVNNIVIENPEAIDGISPGQILRIPIEKIKQPEVAIDSTTRASTTNQTSSSCLLPGQLSHSHAVRCRTTTMWFTISSREPKTTKIRRTGF